MTRTQSLCHNTASRRLTRLWKIYTSNNKPVTLTRLKKRREPALKTIWYPRASQRDVLYHLLRNA